jgi:serine/threonine-protein kinase
MAELPTTFGKYYLTELLATGGMAEIYLAKIIGPGGFEKPLVIKQIHPKLSGQRHFVDLFVAEAKTLVTLTHGNIVPVYELGVVDDTYFIAMDYIDGPTLYRLTETMARRDARMEPVVAAWITARILDGLDYAHRKGEGVIHRDLSPRNVMLSRDGEVKLVDFGIAVTLGDPGEGDSQSAPTGSFPYMSPEQVRRESLTPQTDLFTVGVLFWEMLVGERLFARNEADATLAAVLSGEIPRPSSRRSNIPSRLDELAMKALERDPAKRWDSAGDMRDAINRYLYSITDTPGPKDVAALVAKFCPPETRRLPTHLEAAAQEANVGSEPHEERSGPTTMPSDAPREAAGSEANKPGPHTAVIPRDGSQPKGKRARRHQTFATNVDLKNILERAASEAEPSVNTPSVEPDDTGPVTLGEVSTDQRADPTPLPGRIQRDSADLLPAPTTRRPRRPTTERPDVIDSAESSPRLGRPPSRAALIATGIGALALSGIAVYVFYSKRSDVLYNDAGTTHDAAHLAMAPEAAPIDALADAAESDAALEPDAARDAGPRVRDAAPIPTRIDAGPKLDAAAVPTGTAMLTLGASPWAHVYIDGVKQKHDAPATFKVTPGHHEIKLVFDAESPAIEWTQSIDIRADETQSFTHDFH